MSRAVAVRLPVKPTLTDRLLSLITEVSRQERRTAFLLATNMFVLLATYYILKTVREALILSEGGAEVKSYSAAGQALLLLFVVPAYGAMASKFRRGALIAGTTSFFILNLAAFYLAGKAGAHVGVMFFLWVGIFNLMITAQFWAFANDIYDPQQGKRLLPLVGIGSSLGAWAGAAAAGGLLSIFTPYQLMLVAAAGLAFCIALTASINRREAATREKRSASRVEAPLGKEGGFRLVFKTRYLLLIAGLTLVLNVVNTTGEFILGKLVVDDANRAVAAGTIAASEISSTIGKFYASFYSAVNLLGFLLQLFVVSRLFKFVGVRGALFFLPAIALAGYSLIAVLPLLGIVRIGKVLENSTDYSVQNTARHALFLPTSREAKYKAKAAIDSFFWRTGDMLQAGIVWVGTSLSMTVRGYAGLNIVLITIWLCIVIAIYREHRKLEAAPVG
jgi:AAA family ATP:ADP antiporter